MFIGLFCWDRDLNDVMDPRGVFKLAGDMAIGDPRSGWCKVLEEVATAGKHKFCKPSLFACWFIDRCSWCILLWFGRLSCKQGIDHSSCLITFNVWFVSVGCWCDVGGKIEGIPVLLCRWFGGGNWNTFVSMMSFVMNALFEGDITGGDTGELTTVECWRLDVYGDIKEGEHDVMWSGDRAESTPRKVCG